MKDLRDLKDLTIHDVHPIALVSGVKIFGFQVSAFQSRKKQRNQGLAVSVYHCFIPARAKFWTRFQRKSPPDICLRGVPREQKMLKRHLLRVIYHQVY